MAPVREDPKRPAAFDNLRSRGQFVQPDDGAPATPPQSYARAPFRVGGEVALQPAEQFGREPTEEVGQRHTPVVTAEERGLQLGRRQPEELGPDEVAPERLQPEQWAEQGRE